MYTLDQQVVTDNFPGDFNAGGAIMGPAIRSNGGYFNILNNPVYVQLAYSPVPAAYAYGQVTWTKAIPFPTGPGIIAPGTVGIRFKNYTPGSAALVSGSLSEHSEPQIAVTSSGNASPTAVLVPVTVTFPASPTNQQQIIFTDSLINPTYSWLLQWDTGMTTPGWRFIGGSAIRAISTTLTLPRAGSYDIHVSARVSTSGASPAAGGLSIATSSGALSVLTVIDNNLASSSGQNFTLATTGPMSARLTGAAASAVITLSATGSGSSAAWVIEATPVVIT